MDDLPPEDARKESAALHRIRVGLTGLGCVFLLVLLATAFLRMAGGPGMSGNSQAPVAANSLETPSEPLAQLGVVPGNAPTEPVNAPAKVGAKR